MLKATDQVTVVINLTRTYDVTADAVTVAKLAGITLAQLNETVEGHDGDGYDWEPEESTLATMAAAGEITSEEWDVEEIYES